MRGACLLSGACLLTGLPLTALNAQDLAPVTLVEAGPPAPSDRFDTITYGATASLDISEKKAETNLSAGGDLTTTRQAGGGTQVQDALLWKAGLQIPLAGNADLTDDATLDFLDGGLTFTGGVTWKHFTSSLQALADPVFEPYLEEAIAECARQAGRTAEQCAVLRSLPPAQAVRDYLPRIYRQLDRTGYAGFWTVGLSGSLGFRNFDYVLPGTLAEKDVTHESYSVKLSGVYYPADRVSAFKLEAEYGEAYEPADETIVCKDVVSVPSEDCKKASPMAPEKQESLVFRAEMRRYLVSLDGGSGLGLALTGSVDALSGDLGVELPLYYNLGAKSPILPGIKFGYKKDVSKASNEDEEFSASVFLKTAFSL